MCNEVRSLLLSLFAISMVLASSRPSNGQELKEQDVNREFGYIAMKDGVKLAYVIYRPTKEQRYPILLELSPYNVDGSNSAG